MKKSAIVTLFALLITSAAFPQEMQNTYKSYNFISPQLQSGEYIVSFYASRYSNKIDYTTDGSTDIRNSSSKHFYGSLDGIIAFSNEILFNFNFTYYPDQLSGSYLNKSGSFESSGEINSDSFIIPTMGLIFKPSPNFEIYGNFSFSKSKLNQSGTFSSNFSSSNDSQLISENYNSFSFGVNYFGRLW